MVTHEKPVCAALYNENFNQVYYYVQLIVLSLVTLKTLLFAGTKFGEISDLANFR